MNLIDTSSMFMSFSLMRKSMSLNLKLFFPRKTIRGVRREICNMLYREGQLPLKYLRALIAPKRVSKSDLNCVVQSTIDKIGSW